jgi:uncharacterized repeat protein (TIGR02543 family)/LPXTG-motif cell wall-anchored protein
MVLASFHPRRIALFIVTLLLSGLVGVTGSPTPAAYASDPNSLNLYIDSPFVQGSYVASYSSPANSMNFDTNTTGAGNCAENQPTGIAITGTCSINTVQSFGGASNSANDTATVAGSGSKFATTAHVSNPVIITLTNQSRYLGLWWSAGSTGNTMKFYNGSELLLTVTLQDMINLLGTGPANSSAWTSRNNDSSSNVITALNGTQNRKVWYFGNPRGYTSTTPTSISTISANEPFVYLHMFVGGNLTFNKVELSGQGFEFDNLTVSDVAQTPNPRLVLVSETLQIGLNTVQFNGNGADVQGTMTRQVANSTTGLTANSFTRPGYTFGGWTTSADGTGTAYADAASYPFTASTTLYAKWNPISYTVTYDTQGGSAVAAGGYTIGTSVTLPAAPTRSGFTFAGWFTATTGGTALGSTYSPPGTGNITLYAQWTPAAAPASLTALARTGVSEQTGLLGLGFSALLIALGAGFLWVRRRISL